MKMYKKPTTEIFDLQGENLMQGALAPVSSGGSSSQSPDPIEGE